MMVLEPNIATTSWQALLGYAGQAIISASLKDMGYEVTDEEKTVYYKNFVGHIDGKLSGGDLDGRTAIWDSKIFSAFRYRQMLKGLPEGDGGIYLQQQVYIAAEKADLGIITVAPSDLSTNRSLMNQYKVEGDPRVNPIVIYPDPTAMEVVDMRASMLEFAVENRITPQKEFNPQTARFPCPFCPFKELCIMVGDTEYVVEPLPEHWGR